MKKIFFYIAALTLASCSNNADNDTTTTDTTSTAEKALEVAGEVSTQQVDSLCFLSLNDAKKKDTLAVKLVIKGDDVTGKMIYQYHQKDGRRGNLLGKKRGDRIETMWTYMQEGVTDSLKVYFKIKDDVLHQREPAYDADLNQEDLPNDKAYKQLYQKVDCSWVTY